MSIENVAKRRIGPDMTCHCGAGLTIAEFAPHVRAEHPDLWTDEGPHILIDATGDVEREIRRYP